MACKRKLDKGGIGAKHSTRRKEQHIERKGDILRPRKKTTVMTPKKSCAKPATKTLLAEKVCQQRKKKGLLSSVLQEKKPVV